MKIQISTHGTLIHEKIFFLRAILLARLFAPSDCGRSKTNPTIVRFRAEGGCGGQHWTEIALPHPHLQDHTTAPHSDPASSTLGPPVMIVVVWRECGMSHCARSAACRAAAEGSLSPESSAVKDEKGREHWGGRREINKRMVETFEG